jgi:hypothetical protein
MMELVPLIISQETETYQLFLKRKLLENTKKVVLFNTKAEFNKQISKLEHEELADIGQYLFEEGFRRISSTSYRTQHDLIEVLTRSFGDLRKEFRNYLNVHGKFQGTVADYVGQIIRYLNFIKRLQNLEEESVLENILLENLKEITEFIFTKKRYMKPNTFNEPDSEDWAEALIYIEKDFFNKNGYEAYYAAGLAEIIRTMSNKKRHIEAYPINFETDLDFYYDYSQMISIYNLAIYSFIELLGTWISVKPFIEENFDNITKWKHEKIRV